MQKLKNKPHARTQTHSHTHTRYLKNKVQISINQQELKFCESCKHKAAGNTYCCSLIIEHMYMLYHNKDDYHHNTVDEDRCVRSNKNFVCQG